jgi:hypothetical protein
LCRICSRLGTAKSTATLITRRKWSLANFFPGACDACVTTVNGNEEFMMKRRIYDDFSNKKLFSQINQPFHSILFLFARSHTLWSGFFWQLNKILLAIKWFLLAINHFM